MSGRIEARLAELGIELPAALAPQANYAPFAITGNLVFVAGQLPKIGDELITGKLGDDTDIETGRKAARYCALNVIAQIKDACGGDLDRVRRCVKVGGFVNGAADFGDSPQVMNGASDVFVEVFGDAGRHARFALAVACLPLNAAVEIDAVFEIG